MKNYTQLTYSKRIKLEALFSLKMTKNEVAAAGHSGQSLLAHKFAHDDAVHRVV